VYPYQGNQVRDNIHSEDVACFMSELLKSPRVAEVYSLGGGKHNSCSILEAFHLARQVAGRAMKWQYVDSNRKMRSHYPAWDVGLGPPDIFEQMAQSYLSHHSQPAGAGPQ
jgi:CDP-paratose 2-epimerase